MDNLKIYLG
jgi:hypothetical protein